MAILQVRVDDELKNQANEIYNELNIRADVLNIEVEQNGAYILSNGERN